MKLTTQAEFMRHYNENNREHFNPDLFKRDNQELVDSLFLLLKSCERDRYFTLKLLSFTPIWDYEEIYNTLRAHEESKKKKSSKTDNSYDFINIKDTDMILVKVEWYIRHNGVERIETENGTIEVVNPEDILEVLIALPRFTKGYYFRLSGNYYTTIFQIVDGSTYNNTTASKSKVDTITMKTMFMPNRIFRSFREMVDVRTKETIKVIEYNAIIFNNVTNAMYYLLACYGLYGVSQFLEIDCVFLSTHPVLREDTFCFEHRGIYISCPKICFKDAVVQAFVATIYTAIGKDTNINDLFNIRFWMKNLGFQFKSSNVNKGLFVLDSIDGIYDLITKRDLHLSNYNKENIYTIIRWLLREFSNLRMKENVDVRTKRLRIADYVIAVYAPKLSKGITRISDLGPKVTLRKVVQAIYTQPMYIINNISTMSNLVAYRDMVNDNDATTALKYTYKGISGLGEEGKLVQPIYRYVDPSHIGILDLDASTKSDPGMTGMLCPMTNLYNGSFSEYEEPDTWRDNYKIIDDEYRKGKIKPTEFTGEKSSVSYDYKLLREKVINEDLEMNKIICPVYNDDPNILYTHSGARLEPHKEVKMKSLFTIRKEEE